MDKFIYCPNCDSDQMEETDYEDENGEEDTDGRRCDNCKWEGDVSELVCHDDDTRDRAERLSTDNRIAQEIDERREAEHEQH